MRGPQVLPMPKWMRFKFDDTLASEIACRNDPAPLSLVLVTVMVVEVVPTEDSKAPRSGSVPNQRTLPL